MEPVSFQTYPSADPSWSIEPVQSSRRAVRLRSACDACHEAKIKCSGGTTCIGCQVAQLQCTYSLGSRLGRPKGSKNKSRKKNHDNDSDNLRQEGPVSHQQSDSLAAGFDFSHTFDAMFAGNHASDGVFDDLLNPALASFINTTNTKDGHNSLFSQISSPHHTQLIETPPNSARHDSAYATNTPSSTSTNHSMRRSSHTLHTASNSSSCTCLQQQVQLVYQLGDLQDFHARGPTVDRVLQSVESAQEPWENLMQCARCHSPEHQKEVFLLFATSIRILLSSVQRLDTDIRPAYAPRDKTTGKPALETSKIDVSVGNFELTGEAKTEVIAVVLQRARRIITSALLHLRGRIGPEDRSLSVSTGNGASETPGLSQFTI